MPGGGIRKTAKDAQKIWEGEINGKKTRILQLAEDDCIVEELLVPADSNGQVATIELSYIRKDIDGLWCATSDEVASEAYMKAFLETRKQLKDVADFAVGHRPEGSD